MTQLEINFKDAQSPKHAVVSLSQVVWIQVPHLLLKCR